MYICVPKIGVFRRNVRNTCLPLKSPTTSAGCLVERKGPSLNHTLYHALALEISESGLARLTTPRCLE